MQVRVLSKFGEISTKLYKFNNYDEMIIEHNKQKKYGNNICVRAGGVNGLNGGQVTPMDQRMIDNLAQDYAYKEMNVTIGDFFMLADENIFAKDTLDKKPNAKLEADFNRKKKKELLKLNLWNGTANEVAEMTGYDITTVYSYRKDYQDDLRERLKYAAEEQNNEAEEESRKKELSLPKQNNNQIMNTENTVKNSSRKGMPLVKWNQSEIDLFKTNATDREISEKIGRTILAVAWKRMDVKKKANSFQNVKPVNETVKAGPKKLWSRSEIALFKKNLTTAEIAAQTGRSENAVILKSNKLKAAGKIPKNRRARKEVIFIQPTQKKSWWSGITAFFKSK